MFYKPIVGIVRRLLRIKNSRRCFRGGLLWWFPSGFE